MVGFTKYFKQSHFASMSDIMKERRSKYNGDDNEDSLSNLFIVLLVMLTIVLGFMAVPNICGDNSERGKNTRLGLYFLLLITGGQVGWLYILLWITKINICM